MATYEELIAQGFAPSIARDEADLQASITSAGSSPTVTATAPASVTNPTFAPNQQVPTFTFGGAQPTPAPVESPFVASAPQGPVQAGSISFQGYNFRPSGQYGDDAISAYIESLRGLGVDPLLPGFTEDTSRDAAAFQMEQQARVGLLEKVATGMKRLGGIGEVTRKAEETAGVPVIQKQLADLNSRITQRSLEFQQGQLSLEGQTIPQGLIVGQQAALRRQQAFEIGALSAQRAALQGQLETAQQVAQRAVDVEYNAAQQEINAAKFFLDVNQENMTDIEKRQGERLSKQLEAREAQLLEDKSNKERNFKLMLDVAKAGGDAGAIDPTKGYAENILIAAPYLVEQGSYQFFEADRYNPARLVDKNTGQILPLTPEQRQRLSTGSTAGRSQPTGRYATDVNQAQADLQRGVPWGTVYNSFKSLYPNTSGAQIDAALGADFWRQPGAYEEYRARQRGFTTGISPSITATGDISNNDLLP